MFFFVGGGAENLLLVTELGLYLYTADLPNNIIHRLIYMRYIMFFSAQNADFGIFVFVVLALCFVKPVFVKYNS